MSTLPPPNGTDFTPPPEGTHRAVCYRVIDLGTQKTEFQGQVKHQHKIMLSWELSDELMEDGHPFAIHQRYTWSTHEKATLRHHLEAWRGKAFQDSDFGPNGFNIKNVIGAPCLLGVVHNQKDGKTYANIRSISKMPKGMEAPKPVNDQIYFWMDGKHADTMAQLSDGLKQTIQKSPEYQEMMGGKSNGVADAPPAASDGEPADFNDDIPF